MERVGMFIIPKECNGLSFPYICNIPLNIHVPTNSVTCTLFTSDSKFVLSGSDDGNVRLWKANASEKLGIIDSRERAALEYRDALKERWKMDREVGKIVRFVYSLIFF